MKIAKYMDKVFPFTIYYVILKIYKVSPYTIYYIV